MLDSVLRHRPSHSYTPLGQCFYNPEGAVNIANACQLWRGFHQSLTPAMGQMLLNLDVSATAFYQPGPLLDVAAQLLGRQSSDFHGTMMDKDRNRIEKYLKGLKIVTTHKSPIKRRYRVTHVTPTNAHRTYFPLNNSGVQQNVCQYFLEKYGIRLKYPHLPIVVAGDPLKPVYLPMEVCEIMPGQRHLRKLNERQFTCQPPHIRLSKISSGIHAVHEPSDEYLQAFGVSINSEMATVSARVLQPPSVSYHPSSKESTITPREGAWNLRDKMLAQGVTIHSWAVIAFGAESDYPLTTINKFISMLVQTASECGMVIDNKSPPVSYAQTLGNSQPLGSIEKSMVHSYMLAGNASLARPQLLVCILPNTGVSLYAEIKRVSDTVLGIATQCIQARHMFAAKRQYCANVCLKLNVKLGGLNSYISSSQLPFVSERPTIIFGADLIHPASGSNQSHSTAALVGSMHAQCSQYSAAIRSQQGRVPYIDDLKGMAIELLKTFYQTCGCKPERILFYRDNLSDGELSNASAYEIEALRAACLELEEYYRPHITYVAVQKRHHARFFPLRKEDADRSGNVLPGTVIEVDVTHPYEFDFYLCSHPGLQGTSKPTHYHILCDENGFTADSLQELTYRLCYLYCRATRSVSVVPPAYYAHLVAARAKFHSVEDPNLVSDTVSIASTGSGRATLASGGLVKAHDVILPTTGSMGSSSSASISGKRHVISSVGSTTGEPKPMIHHTVKADLARVMYFM